jgi:hypothetical protein
MAPGYDYDAADSVRRLSPLGFPDFQPNFSTVLLSGSAKLTDLISTAPIPNCGLLISSRFRRLLESSLLPPHRFFPVPMIHRRKPVEGYWWIHLPQQGIAIADDTTAVEVERLVEANPDCHKAELIRLYSPPRFSYCFVSDLLRRAMENEGITGVRFGTARIFR